MESLAPGPLAVMELGTAGMHTTHNIDFIYVISGEVIMTLNDGTEVYFAAGDTVVQNVTHHAWRNSGQETCVL